MFLFACGKQAFSRVVDEIKALKTAQEDGWVPKLKVRIIRGRDTFDVAYVP